jgi:hypothetical protein
MVGWPQITEPLLRERQGMSNERFFESEQWTGMPVEAA